jgi:hypothetical protein
LIEMGRVRLYTASLMLLILKAPPRITLLETARSDSGETWTCADFASFSQLVSPACSWPEWPCLNHSSDFLFRLPGVARWLCVGRGYLCESVPQGKHGVGERLPRNTPSLFTSREVSVARLVKKDQPLLTALGRPGVRNGAVCSWSSSARRSLCEGKRPCLPGN